MSAKEGQDAMDPHSPVVASHRRASRGVLGLGAGLALMLAMGACTNGDAPYLERPADWSSGPDARRYGASEITLDTTVVDNVDNIVGDRTDWKYFTVPASGIVAVSVTFDNHNALGEMLITDEVGRTLATFEDEKRRLLDKVTFKANPGRYYIQIVARVDGSDYSLEAQYQPLQLGDM